jgi:hypothetical protein
MKSDYIIDFERINQLTSTIHDDTSGKNHSGIPYSVHSISKNIIKQYLDIYMNKDSRHSDKSKLIEAIETLEYNKILISKSTIRDNTINQLL